MSSITPQAIQALSKPDNVSHVKQTRRRRMPVRKVGSAIPTSAASFEDICSQTKARVQRYLDRKAARFNPRRVKVQKGEHRSARVSKRVVKAPPRKPAAWVCRPSQTYVPWKQGAVNMWDVRPSYLPAWSKPKKVATVTRPGMSVSAPVIPTSPAPMREDSANKTGYWWWPKRQTHAEVSFTHRFDDGEEMTFSRVLDTTGLVRAPKETRAQYKARKAANKTVTFLNSVSEHGATWGRHNWSGLVARLERRAQDESEARKLARGTSRVAPGLNTLSCVNQFDGLLSVGEPSAPEGTFDGSARLSRTTPRRSKNERFAAWSQKCLLIKMQRIQQSMEKCAEGKRVPSPEGEGDLEMALTEIFGDLSYVDTSRYVLGVETFKNKYSCPENGFVVNLRHDNSISLVSAPGTKGVAFKMDDVIVGHAGIDVKDEEPPSPIRSEMLYQVEAAFASGRSDRSRSSVLSRSRSSSIQSGRTNELQDCISALVTEQYVPYEFTNEHLAILNSQHGKARAMDLTKLFGYCCWWKGINGCPTNEFHVNVNRFKNRFEKLRPPVSMGPGLYWYIDGHYLFHCGSPRARIIAKFWMLAARCLREGKTKVESIEKASVSLGFIECQQPNAFHQLINGFTVKACVGSHAIFARGYNFQRQCDTNDDVFVTPRQGKRFWPSLRGDDNRKLAFTPQGLAKVFRRKSTLADMRWKWAIATQLGLTVDAAEVFFSQFPEDLKKPDVVAVQVGQKPLSLNREERTVTLFVQRDQETQKPAAPKVSNDNSSPPPPPAPVMPKTPVVRMPKVEMADGDLWLRKSGADGVSNRALFRTSFPDDWWNRVSEEALKLMNQDASSLPGYRAKFTSKLVVDPSQSFNIYDVKSRKIVPRGPLFTGPTPLESIKAGKFSLRRTETNVKSSANVGRVLDEPLLIEVKENRPRKERRPITSKDKEVMKQFKRSRSSTEADIETNPGPMNPDDVLTYNHPQPSIVTTDEKGERIRHIEGQYVLAAGSPLGSNFKITEATPEIGSTSPVDKKVIHSGEVTSQNDILGLGIIPKQDGFLKPRGSEEADIETNPGPSRPNSPGPSRGRSFTDLLDKSSKSRDVSPARAVSRIHDFMGIHPSTDLDSIRKSFNLRNPDVFHRIEIPASNWLNDKYRHHFKIGSFPTDIAWSTETPVMWKSASGLADRQKSLNTINVANDRFDQTKIGHLYELSLMFITSLKDQKFGHEQLSGLAHYVKCNLQCPDDGNGYAINYRPIQREISIHITDVPDTETRNRLWWCVNGYNCYHGGDENRETRLPQPRSRTQIFKGASKSAHLQARQYLEQRDAETLANPNVERRARGMIPGAPAMQFDVPLSNCHCCLHNKPKEDDGQLSFDMAKWEKACTCDCAYCPVRMRGQDEDIYWLYYLFTTLVAMLVGFYSYYSQPDFDGSPDALIVSKGEYPNRPDDTGQTPSEQLLVCAFGTHGDQIPVKYYANLAAHFGVATNYHVFHHFTSESLDKMHQGDFMHCFPGYVRLYGATSLGYKKAFVPHLEIPFSKGMTYRLQATEKWAHPVKFQDPQKKLNVIQYISTFFAELIGSVYQPNFNIGCLPDSDLPRSADGKTLLKKRTNLRRFKEGWLSGSSSETVIPEEVRKRCPKIPSGDHNKIFCDYETIHMHGGAGTLQTALMCGARPVIHDKRLDRNYHTMPTTKQCSNGSIAPFMGWLVWSGFKPVAPIEVKAWWLFRFFWHQKWTIMLNLLYNGFKAYAIFQGFISMWSWLLLLFFSVSVMTIKIIIRKSNLTEIGYAIGTIVWGFPFVILTAGNLKYVLYVDGLFKLLCWLAKDVANWMDPRTRLYIEPVERGGIKFPHELGLGHWALRDELTGDVYEGLFENGEDQTISGKFKFVCRKREMKPNSTSFTIPFNVARARQLVALNESDNYSGMHNCVSLATKVLRFDSVRGTFFGLWVTLWMMLILLPPEYITWAWERLFPHDDIRKSRFYQGYGFAAGIEQIPIEPELDVEETLLSHLDSPSVDEIQESEYPDYSDPSSLDMVIDELHSITDSIKLAAQIQGLPEPEEEMLQEVRERGFAHTMGEIKIPEDSMVRLEPIPPYVKHTWAQIVDAIHHCLSLIRLSAPIDGFIAWLRTIEANILEFMEPVLMALSKVGNLLYEHSTTQFRSLFEVVCSLMDYAWGLEASKRVKTVWGLTGLHTTGLLGVKARLAASIAYADRHPRTTFQNDYNRFVGDIKQRARSSGVGHLKHVGGPQRRRVAWGTPVMTHEEAELLGFKTGEYVTRPEYDKRIESYRQQGVPQGADGVLLAAKTPGLLEKSIHRYEPRYPDSSEQDRYEIELCAKSMFDRFPEVFADCQVLPPQAVKNYIKPKYSPGTPFINDGGFKSRQAMFDAGYDKIIERRAIEMLKTGQYPVQFYHAFAKSQVVDIRKCLPPELGGKGKDVRTVVSQDLFSYMIDQCIQIERNKRINWDTFGAGIGMPLNQSMAILFERMADKMKEFGGRYIAADATAFDSGCKPLLFEGAHMLWELGFKDHPSGNGKNIASVIKASYDSRQNAWILGVTQDQNSRAFSICVKDEAMKTKLLSRKQFLSWKDLAPLPREKQIQLSHNKVIIVDEPTERPVWSSWQGLYRYGDIDKANQEFQAHLNWIYPNGQSLPMEKDIMSLANSNYDQLFNVHSKDSGGSTGGSDTSMVNTIAFKLGFMLAWSRTTGLHPDRFWEFNDLANTSDDTLWWTGGIGGLNHKRDIEVFRQHCLELGIKLTLETTKKITEVEYLSKFVRTPTPEDCDTLKAWRRVKIANIRNLNKRAGLKDLSYRQEQAIRQLNNPRFLVVQNPNAILLRRSAFRYYQGGMTKWRYTSVERGAGHANNTAFVPELYSSFAREWCEDVNVLLEQQNIHKKYILVSKNELGMPGVKEIDWDPKQSRSQRQLAFLGWLKGNMYPSYYRVVETHMHIAQIDPTAHEKFLARLNRGWRGIDEILKEGVDALFWATDSIPDEWSKKFQPGVSMLYAETTFYTRSKIIEKFIYLKMLEEGATESEVTFSALSQRVQESPYAACCDIYHFWEQLADPEFKRELTEASVIKYQGLVMCISLLYMTMSLIESSILALPVFGILYKLMIWSFVGLNKVYGVTNTLYWHSTAKSSREISRIMPRDPYMNSKRFCAFVIDLIPQTTGLFLMPMCAILDALPPLVEAIGKTWFVGGKLKDNTTPNVNSSVNPWSSQTPDWVSQLRASPTRRAYVAAKTSTGKSTWFVAAIQGHKSRLNIRKIWLVEPRKVLRDETEIPFCTERVQKLKAGVSIRNDMDIHILTYGHLQSRIHDIDNDDDIVLFDEFHEEQGEMILGLETVRAPIFLLSATPAEIPSLVGTPTITPQIDRRHEIKVYKVPDGTSPTEMFQEAQNRVPELMDRVLVVVPTLKRQRETIEALTYLKAGQVFPLDRFNRTVPKEGIIVATPYVQTGLDIKPPPNVLIDCGTDVIIDKGKFVSPLPWTDPDIDKQRIGRVGRLREGVVFQPQSAGTGKKAVKYPSPNLFQHEAVARHFKMKQLTPITGAVTDNLPFLRLNFTKLTTRSQQRSVTLIHAFALAGLRQVEWKTFYARCFEGRRLGEDHEFISRILDHPRWVRAPLLPWEMALTHLNRREVVEINIAGRKKWCKPLTAINGQWIELEECPTEKMDVEEITQGELDCRFVKLQQSLNKLKDGFLSMTKSISEHDYHNLSSIEI